MENKPPQAIPQAPVVSPNTTPPVAPPASHHTPTWMMLAMLFIFPPVGWFFMWREREYHSWFATTVFFYGLMGFVLNAIIILVVAPYLPTIYSGIGISDPSPIPSKYMLSLGVIIADLLMFFGIYLWYYVKKHGEIHGPLLVFTALLLFINYFVPTISAIISVPWLINTFKEVMQAM
jgi:hypothetical protein